VIIAINHLLCAALGGGMTVKEAGDNCTVDQHAGSAIPLQQAR